MSSVVFIHLGPKLPRYVNCSMLLAKQFSGQDVVFLGQETHRRKLRKTGVDFVPIEEFYNPKTFDGLTEKVTRNHEFRQGFWLKTLERFFVLQQFMEWSSRESIFHAELDQLLFGTDDLVASIKKTERRGIFVPFHGSNKAVASVLFVNNKAALDSLLDFAARGEPFQNEMELLARFSRSFPDLMISLPTVGEALPPPAHQDLIFTKQALHPNELGPGVVDPVELGLWIGGRDPRSLPLSTRPSTKWTYGDKKAALGKDYLRNLGFNLVSESARLEVKRDSSESPVRLYNLHLHSKIHCWIRKRDPHLRALIAMANSSEQTEIPAARRSQIAYSLAQKKGRPRKQLKMLVRILRIEVSRKVLGLMHSRERGGQLNP